jgi:hemoglobin
LTMVFGGPNHYTGLDMRKAHAPLVASGLDDTHVSAVVYHLRQTLRELGVDAPLVQQVIDIAESVRNDVLSR